MGLDCFRGGYGGGDEGESYSGGGEGGAVEGWAEEGDCDGGGGDVEVCGVYTSEVRVSEGLF